MEKNSTETDLFIKKEVPKEEPTEDAWIADSVETTLDEKKIAERKKKDNRMIKWLKTALLGAAVTTGAATMEGCEDPNTNAPTKGQGTRQVENAPESQELRVTVSTLLDNMFETGPGTNGTVVNTDGGNYFELDDQAMENLFPIAYEYENGLDRLAAQPENSNTGEQVLQAHEKVTKMKLHSAIQKYGKRVSYEQLPQKLKAHEDARRQAVEEMSR